MENFKCIECGENDVDHEDDTCEECRQKQKYFEEDEDFNRASHYS